MHNTVPEVTTKTSPKKKGCKKAKWDAGKDRRWKEKGMTEVVMVGWHHQLDRYGFG